jgi:PAS domain S-box-containing protein
MAKTTSKETVKDVLQIISEATSGLVGKDLLDELCMNFTRALKMQFAVIAECIEEGGSHVRTLCFVNGNTVADNIEYDITGRPCEMILQGNDVFVPKEVYKKFPEAKSIEAATGVPIYSSVSGKIIGHIIISNLQPVTEESNQLPLLKIFAARIGAELERMKAEKELHRQMKENEFYAFTINHLREAVFWVDQDGYIWQVNDAATELSGYTKDELKKMHVFDLNQSVQNSNWESVWNRLKEKKKVTIDAKFKRKDERFIDIEITQNFMVFEGREYTCSIVRDIRKRKMEEDLLRTVSERTAGVTGEDYFTELTKFITSSLDVRYSMVVECSNGDSTKLRMLSYIDRQEVLENIEYDTTGTPCEIVMQGKDFFCANDLEKTFPREKGIQSWVAVPIFAPSTGKVIGNIAAFDNVPMRREQNQTSILKIFAARAGAEIERIEAQKNLAKAHEELNNLLRHQLNESEQRFRDLFEEAPIAYVHEGLDSKWIKANRAALRILGVRPDEVPYIYGKKMAPDTPDAQRRMKEAFESVGRGTDTSGVVLELLRRDNGQTIWIQWWSNPDPGGEFTRTMFIDITDKVLMEQEQARLRAQNKYLQDEIKLTYNFEEIITRSSNFQKVLRQIEQVASTDATVLIMGESGTGKELMARAVHNISNRSKRPLVKVNCATLPANLIESELFGHEKGAFTGAMERKIGRFELADGGSIFLDEIGELPVELQSKLLRVLQEGEFERLGNPKTMKVNVRVIAATNRNLHLAIEKKEFREDLYYRLNVFPITCPPLRDRKEDIPLLVKHFCQKHEGKIGRKINNV